MKEYAKKQELRVCEEKRVVKYIILNSSPCSNPSSTSQLDLPKHALESTIYIHEWFV